MNYLITNHKNSEEKQEIMNKGLFCYDLRHSDDGSEIATIEKSVLVNRVGSIITDEELKFGNKAYNDFIGFEEFSARNNEVDTLEELLVLKISNMEEINYYSFCIAYDFLNDFYKNSGMPECDVVNEETKKLAKRFMRSENYKDISKSSYENLGEWIEENKEQIKKSYIRTYTKPLKKEVEAR